jgi:hypothetical protein
MFNGCIAVTTDINHYPFKGKYTEQVKNRLKIIPQPSRSR